jgi:proline dehydrogenase
MDLLVSSYKILRIAKVDNKRCLWKVNTTTVKITELPPSLTYEKYEDILDKLVENNDIVSYDDN